MLITPSRLDKACEVLTQADVIAVDTETHWTKEWHERILIGLSTYCKWGEKSLTCYFPYRHGHDNKLFSKYNNLDGGTLQTVVEAIKANSSTLLFHNAKFDLTVFKHEGLELDNHFYCTMLMSHMIDENTDHGLGQLCKLLKIDPEAKDTQEALKSLGNQLGGWHKIPPEVMEMYACNDARLTYKLWRKLMPAFKEQELDKIWPTEEEFCRLLVQMEWEGIGIDVQLGKELSAQAELTMIEIEKNLGFNPMKVEPLVNKIKELGFKFPELGKPTKTFPEGRPLLPEKILQRMKHPVVERVLEYRGLVKRKSTWFDGLVSFCDPTGRVHPNFKQHGTETSRLSCSQPNMHQLPRNIEEAPVKKMLQARPGYQLWEFDYSQIEFRLAAVYAGERSILDAYKVGSDFHNLTANTLGVPRHDGKTINFTILYGGGSGKLAEAFGFTLEQGRQILDAFNKAYPKLAQVRNEAMLAAQRRGYIKLWTGRRRHFQHHWECKDAFNSLIQGGAAEIVKRGMVEVDRTRDGYNRSFDTSILVSQVHDAVWYELLNEAYAYDVYRIKLALEWPSRDPEFLIPFPTEHKRLA
jgi:DNA polymerase-1